MKGKIKILFTLFLHVIAGFTSLVTCQNTTEDQFIVYVVNPKLLNLRLYWKDDNGQILNNFANLKSYVESNNEQLLFAMNGGMFKTDSSPLGLFIQNNKTIRPLNTKSDDGNFYKKPNGVFYISIDNIANICKTEDFTDNGQIKYATQSGPMLIINGQIHPAFKQGSYNINIRNGVGILPDNKVIFIMSKNGINFYDFAYYFKSLGCKKALYLDGVISKTYLPEKNWIQTDGSFGVIIGVTEPNYK